MAMGRRGRDNGSGGTRERRREGWKEREKEGGRERRREGRKESEREEGREGDMTCTVPYGPVAQ